jgi:phosphopentomutase
MKVGDVEDLFENTYGVKVQIKDKSTKTLMDNDLTLGKASRL